jgi:hypothetical protein
MRPGAFSERGFLVPGEHLQDVLARDAMAVRTLGVTFDATCG